MNRSPSRISAGVPRTQPLPGGSPPVPAVGRTGPGRVGPELGLLLGALPHRGGALAVAGAAGSGRSAELAWAADVARGRGLRVVEVSGSRAEEDLPHAVLDRLLDRLRTRRPAGVTGVPTPRPGGGSAAADPLHAVLAALPRAATPPVLLVVDDLHFVDQPSREVVRRLALALAGGSLPGLGLLTATDARSAAGLGAPILTLPPLGPDAARSVVSTRFPELAPQVVERVVQEAEGNLLALVELPVMFSDEQARGREELPPVLHISHRLAAPFGNRVAALPPATRELLLLVALQGSSTSAQVADPRGGLPSTGLSRALSSGMLARAHGGAVRFTHPIGRLTVLAHSTADERRRAHQWWAERSADPVLRIWHRAASRVGPDAGLSASLEHAARVHLQRHEISASVAALVRAGELDPDQAGRSRLLAQAAYVAISFGGNQEQATALLERALEATGPGRQPAYALLAAAHIAVHADGDVAAARRAFSAALRHLPVEELDDPEALTRALAGAVELDALAMRPGNPNTIRAAPGTPAATRSLRLLQSLLDPTGPELTDPGEVDVAIAELADETDATVVLRVAGAVLAVDRLNDCRPALLRVAAAAGGNSDTRDAAEMLLAMGDYYAGRWEAAARRCDQGIALAGPRGDRLREAQFQCIRMMLAASRGASEEVRRLCRDVQPWAVRQGVQSLVTWCELAQGLDATAGGDFEAAFQHAVAVAGSRPGHGAGRATWGSLDLVEAAVRTGRRDVAVDHVRQMMLDDLSRLSPRVSILLPAGRAMTAGGDEAAVFFDEALTRPALEQWPFEHARVRLAYGEWLRRARARREARAELAIAIRLFTELDAPAWVRRATAEIRATATSTHAAAAPRSMPGAGLTPQERQVAELAAAGLTNGDIAAQLLLSPKTVATHLSHTFRKLDIRSRAALRDALGPDGPTSDHSRLPDLR